MIWSKWVKILSCLAIMVVAGFGLCTTAFAAETGDSLDLVVVGAGDDEELDDTETNLDALGFDTTELPEGYDPDSSENPQGAEYSVSQLYSELLAGKNGNGIIFGEDNALDDNYDTFLNTKKGIDGLDSAENAATAAVAANFEGKGRKSDMAYVTIVKGENGYNVLLRIYDSSEQKSSDPITLATGLEIGDKVIKQSIIDISAGDYDGDGIDEIAVMVPFRNAASCGGKISIFDLKADDLDICVASSWKETWTYALPTVSGDESSFWNQIDICSGDINDDKVDDMIVSWGRAYTLTAEKKNSKISPNDVVKSTSVLLMGDKTGKMLRNSQEISHGSNDLIRVAFTIGDFNSDGHNEAFMGGQQLSEAVAGNTSRSIGVYTYDSESSKLIADKINNVKVVDGKTNDDGSWVSGNGYDDSYLSIPAMKANIAITSIFGKSKDTYIYLDSVLYKYDGDFKIEKELDDATHKDDKDKDIVEPFHGNSPYIEYNAMGGYFAGPMTQGLGIERIIMDSNTPNKVRYIADLLYAESTSNESEVSLTISSTVKRSTLYTVEDIAFPGAGFYSGNSFLAAVDTDQDSTVMKYTGNHTFAYTEPKIYAVLASAPYFKDVAENAEGGEDIMAFSSTSWGNSEGNGKADTFEHEASLGIHVETTHTLSYFAGEILYSHSSGTSDGTSYEYSMTYSTVAGEDCVVFYSIPTALYQYEVTYTDKNDKGEYIQKTVLENVPVPYKPVSQTITMETYNDIQKKSAENSNENDALPEIYGKAISSKAGYPESYPSSTKGLKDVLVYPKNWSSPSYSTGGDVSQEISVTTEHEESSANGLTVNLTGLVGPEWLRGGLTTEFSFMWGTTKTYSNGTTASGTVYNMVPDAKGYGYYFAWKLITYNYTAPNGMSFPVVTYLTRDVTKPPTVPDDFAQDYANTTDDQVALKWTYKEKDVQAFDIYRHYEFADGSGDELVGTVDAADYTLKKNKAGELVYDEDGNTIHQYSFVESGLAPYTEYNYSIQARRSKVPPKSIASKPITAKTRAEIHPTLGISDTDLTVYYDTIKTVSVDAKESDSFLYKNKSFQWQKYDEESDSWEDIQGATSTSYIFSKCSLSDEGDYRCRMNTEISVLGTVYRLTVYSDVLTVNFEKRKVSFGEISVKEGVSSTEFSIPVTNSGDGARTQPQGYVYFTLDNGQTSSVVTSKIDGTTNTATAKFENLTAGAYELSTRYVGYSKIFKNATNPEKFTYLKDVTSGTWLSVKKSYQFGENLMDTLKLYELEENGGNSANKIDITSEITRVDLYYTGEHADRCYKSFTLGNDRSAVIPAIDNDAVTGDIDSLEIQAYKGSTCVSKKTISMVKPEISLYLDDIEGDAGESAPEISYSDIKVSGGAYEKGASPFITGETDTEYKAFADTNRFNIGVYTKTGDLLGCLIEPAGASIGVETVDLKALSPGSYTLKVMGGESYNKYKTVEEKFFDMTFEESELILLGDSYYITAYGEKDNGRDVGYVTLISPDQLDSVKDAKYQGGTTLTFKAHPATNYAVGYWIVTESGKDKVLDQTSDTLTYRVQGTSDKITVRAVFSLVENHISLQAIGGGAGSTVSCTSDDIGNDPIIPEGKELTFEAKAAEGYEFVEWRYVTVDGKTTVKSGITSSDKSSSTVNITMGSTSAVVYAIFQRQSIEISLDEHLNAYYLNTSEFNANLAEGTEVKVNNENRVPKGATVIVRPEGGFKVSGEWTVEGVAAEDVKAIESGTAIRFTVPENADAIKVSAKAVAGKFGISVASENDAADITVRINDKETADLDRLDGGSIAEFTASPKRGYVFKNWKVNNKVSENKSSTYTTYITKNMNVVAVCQPIESYEVKASVKGSGSVAYEIETAGGKTVKGNVGDSDKITVYSGESIKFITSPADSFMASYVILNGTREEYTSTSYTISDVDGDNEIVIGIDPAIYHKVAIQNNTDYSLSTESGNPIRDKITLGNKETYAFIVKGAESLDKLFVSLNGEYLEGQEVEGGYRYVIDTIDADAELIIDNYSVSYIYTEADLNTYLTKVGVDGSASAVLMADITLSNGDAFVSTGKFKNFSGSFDGNGHIISGGEEGTEKNPSNRAFTGLFKMITEDGVVKNLTILNCSTYKYKNLFSLGFITSDNRGTIENCTVMDSSAVIINDDEGTKTTETGRTITDCPLLGIGFIAGDNAGTIRNCNVINVTGSMKNSTAIGGIAGANTSLIELCYGENVASDINKITVMKGLVGQPDFVRSDNKAGSISNSYINNGSKYTVDERGDGINIWTDGERIIAGRIAYLFNAYNEKAVWGICKNADDTYPLLINSGIKINNTKPVAPIQVRFSGYKTYYVMSGEIYIPQKSFTGSDGWTDGTNCYGEGMYVDNITKDLTLSMMETSPETYSCKLVLAYNKGVLYFTSLDEAIAEANERGGWQEIYVVSDSILSKDAEISSKFTLNVQSGATLVIEDGAALENKGSIKVENGGVIDNYGKYQNDEGAYLTIEETGKFINRGAFKNFGNISGQEQISCKTHSWGVETVTRQPALGLDGERSIVCEACGKTISETFKNTSSSLSLDPVEIKVTEGENAVITIQLDSDYCSGQIGFASDDSDVAAVVAGENDHQILVTGVKEGSAVITVEYTDGDTSITQQTAVTVEAPVIEHNYGDMIAKVPATCTAAGMEAYYKCSDCGMLFDAEFNETNEAALTIPAEGHDFGKLIPKVDSTITTEGMLAHYQCSKCKTFFDENKKETSEAALTIAKKIDASQFTVAMKSVTYTGEIQKPVLTVKDTAGNVVSSKNYTTTYLRSESIAVGKFGVRFKFKNEYAGTITGYYRILPKGTTLSELTPAKGGFTAKWAKQSERMSQTRITGYSIRVSTNSDMSNAKAYKVSGYSSTSRVISNLTSKKKYYVQIRTYKTVSEVEYYSKWSTKMTVTTK